MTCGNTVLHLLLLFLYVAIYLGEKDQANSDG